MNLQDVLKRYVDAKLVTGRKHPDYDLYIYNYTPGVQYGKLWDEITLMCRGLILDGEGNIVARPFPKFFNLEEHLQEGMPPVPNESFDVFEKMDGSLGISYFTPDGKLSIATRGSFTSDQALKAQCMLNRYPTHKMEKGITYLFEIIYPGNRIVVNYGDEERLVLLERIETKTGKCLGAGKSEEDVGFDIVRKYDSYDLNLIREHFDSENKEGFVVKFESGMRVKLKFKEYVQLHRIISEATPLHIWEMLSEGKDSSELLEKMPDELHDEIKAIVSELKEAYNKIETGCINWLAHYREVASLAPVEHTRKDAAQRIIKQEHPDVLFRMLDNKEYTNVIWKKLRPK